MIVTWVILAAVAVAVGVAIVVRLRTRPRVDPLSGLVVDTFGGDWADRTGLEAGTVRSAALRGEPAQVRYRLAALIEGVEIGFETNGADAVHTSVQCRYADGTSATATMDLPWEKVPQEVRAHFLRNGTKTISRSWSFS